MDPQRVHAYLQVACAGLGFDIGEVWVTSNENGASSLAAIEEKPAANQGEDHSRFRFVQLYTSHSYESRRSELLNPPAEEEDGKETFSTSLTTGKGNESLQHVLSPRLVDAISKTAQVVWATTKKQEGLIGRSDIRLQTAVGMPVGMDNNGNMCVVVMFSPNNIQSTDDAMEYLYSISQSATSTSIPCLLPVFDASSGMKQITHGPMNPSQQSAGHHHHHLVPHPDPNSLGEGVSARFVSLDDNAMFGNQNEAKTLSDEPEVHNEHELTAAPKDTYGIPMLPSFAELGEAGKVTPDDSQDAFDEATYGIWTTIMDEDTESVEEEFNNPLVALEKMACEDSMETPNAQDSTSLIILPSIVVPPPLKEARKERLVEFCLAFLGMSVFDLADVWVPSDANCPFPNNTLRHAVTVTAHGSTEAAGNPLLTQFQHSSEQTLIQFWTGAVGRAFSTGNPVWSSNPDSFADSGRSEAFQRAQIRTVLAVPVFSKAAKRPACVVAAYAFVKSDSVPFVLRFVQQALRLLWDGLDHIDQPHVSENVWQSVRACDLGEMAGDVEMQQHFHAKKRSHQSMMIPSSESLHLPSDREEPEISPAVQRLSSQLQSIELPNGDVISIPLHLEEPDIYSASAPPPGSAHVHVEELQNHVNEAVRSVAQVVPLDATATLAVDQQHVNTNMSGSKRAHIMAPTPLAMPQPLPSQIVSGQHVKLLQPLQPLQPQKNSGLRFNSNFVGSRTTAQGPMHGPSTTKTAGIPTAGIASGMAIQQQYAMAGLDVGTAATVPIMTPVQQAGVQPDVPMSTSFCQPIQNNGFSLGTGAPGPEKQCRIQGCTDAAVSKRPYCMKHSGNRHCEQEGCNKCAQGSTRFCIAHGGGRRCTFPGCDKGARDKFFCAAHGGGKRCQYEGGCTKSAVGGSKLCTAHGGGRRCDVPGCGKSAQSSTRFCVKHGGGKKCAHDGCEKVARGRTNYCAAHGGGVRCKLDGCNRVAIGKLQLCRAHGGGSSSNGSRASPLSVSEGAPI